MAEYLLGVDFGTGGAKATVIDDSGTVAGYAFEEYEILTPEPGWSEHDADAYWPVACRIVRAAIAEAGIKPNAVRGVAVSSALPSLVLVDSEHKPVANAYNLMDRRATQQVERIKKTIGEDRVFDVSKNRLDDHPTIVNLLWEKENRPDVYRKIWKALTIDGYITLKLTGVASLHYSGAAFYGVAYNLVERRFEPDLLTEVGIPEALFPDLYPCEAIVGSVLPAAAAEVGLAAGTPVAAGQVDCNAGWVGAGALEDGDIQMNLGTAGNFGIIHTAKTFHRSMIACAYTTRSDSTFITIPTTTTGGGLIRYLRDTLYAAETAAKSGPDPYDIMNADAGAAPIGADGLVMLPFLMGERTPIWDVYARGVIFGLSLNHGRGHIVRAAMESVAYALYHSFSLIVETGQKINTPIVLNEGGAKSSLWRRIITDVFNVPTVLVKRRTGAPYGDAILAGVATGIFPDFSPARDWTELVEPMEPDAAAHKIYTEYFALYTRLYEAVKHEFPRLAELRRLGVQHAGGERV